MFEAEIFKVNVLFYSGEKEKALAVLAQLLDKSEEESDLAAIHYEWYKMSPDEINHRQIAFDLYQKLYKTIPQYLFKTRMKELES